MRVSKQPFFSNLPKEQPAITTARGVATFILFILLFFVGINYGLRVYLQNFTPNFGFWLIREKWNLLLDLQEAKDVVILGDSTSNQAVVPEIIEQTTGLSAINLGTVANLTALNDVWMLREYLKNHHAPRVVIIVHSYQMWHRSLNSQALINIPLARNISKDAAFIPAPPLTNGDFLRERAFYYVPAYAQSSSLRSLVRTVLQIPPDFSLVIRQQFELTPAGYFSVLRQNAKQTNLDIVEHQRFLEERTPEISSENVQALAALVSLANESNLTVFILNAPIAEEVAQADGFAEYHALVDDYLSRLTDGNEHLYYIPEIYSFPSDMMESADHVLEAAAIEYTRNVIIPLIDSQTK